MPLVLFLGEVAEASFRLSVSPFTKNESSALRIGVLEAYFPRAVPDFQESIAWLLLWRSLLFHVCILPWFCSTPIKKAADWSDFRINATYALPSVLTSQR